MLRKRSDRVEVIYELEIDYGSQQDKNLPKEKRDMLFNEIGSEVEHTLIYELPKELHVLYGLDVDIQIRGIREGSIIVFFSAILSIYGIVSNYKDFGESVDLIRMQAFRLVVKAIKHLGNFDVSNVHIHERQVPKLHQRNTLADLLRFFDRHLGDSRSGYMLRELEDEMESEYPYSSDFRLNYPKSIYRNAFFIFLLIFSALEFVTIVLLVAGAVIKTYFP